MRNKTPHSILVHGLLPIEVKIISETNNNIQFDFNAKQIICQNGT